MIFSLIFAASLIYSALAYCPTGTTEYDEKCYGYLGTEFTYKNSYTVCLQTYNSCAHLPTVANVAENNFLTRQTQNEGAWYTWLQYQANGMYYADSNGKPPAYTNWAIGEPFVNSIGYCATIGLNGFWYAQPCADNHNAICQFDKNGCAAPTTPRPTPRPTLPPVTQAPNPGFPSCVQKYLNFVPCPSGWTYYPPSCNCYKIISNVAYYQAMNVCRASQGTLASVHNFGEASFIQRLAFEERSDWVSTASARDNIIIGLSSNGTNYFWDDLTRFDFYNGFAPGEPSDLSLKGQIILNQPQGYATYMKMADCYSQTCRYAVCQKSVN